MANETYGASASSLADFKNIKLLGEGAFAAVYKVLRRADEKIYAIKKVKLPSLSDKEKHNALNEIRLLASVQQDNIVSYKDAFFDDKTRCLCIVTECCDGGDLMEQINQCQKKKTHIAESDIWRWTIGLGRALKALHGINIYHRDMKSANIFLNSTPSGRIAKLGDFNVSTVAKNRLCLTQTGTPYYASPEVWRDMPYDGKSDMWGLGCVVFEAAALKPPFRAEDMEGLAHKVCVGKYGRIPPVFSSDLSEAIGVLLQVNPRHRPTPAQFLSIPIIDKHAMKLNLEEDSPCETDLLSTIKVPRNYLDFQSCLPLPKYVDDSPVTESNLVTASNQAAPGAGTVTESPKMLEKFRHMAGGKHHAVTASNPEIGAKHHAVAVSNPENAEPHRMLERLRRVSGGGQRLARCRSDAVLPRKRRGEVSTMHRVADEQPVHDTSSPQGPPNSLPRIHLNELAPSKALPKGLRLKLPRIASCRGQLA
jgi:serine/threonine protein kinase